MGGGPANYPRGKRTGCTACSESAPAFMLSALQRWSRCPRRNPVRKAPAKTWASCLARTVLDVRRSGGTNPGRRCGGRIPCTTQSRRRKPYFRGFPGYAVGKQTLPRRLGRWRQPLAKRQVRKRVRAGDGTLATLLANRLSARVRARRVPLGPEAGE